jgi:hypothetical protein
MRPGPGLYRSAATMLRAMVPFFLGTVTTKMGSSGGARKWIYLIAAIGFCDRRLRRRNKAKLSLNLSSSLGKAGPGATEALAAGFIPGLDLGLDPGIARA